LEPHPTEYSNLVNEKLEVCEEASLDWQKVCVADQNAIGSQATTSTYPRNMSIHGAMKPAKSA
jgi:hypothetical protein